jgi:hypothetical protein
MTEIICPTCGRPNEEDQIACEFCGTPIETDGLSRLNDLIPPDKSLDESSRLDDLLTPKEPPEESSRLDDLLQPEDTPEESSRLDDLLQPDESSRLDDLISSDDPVKKIPDEPSRSDDLLPDDFTTEDTTPLDDFLKDEVTSEETTSLDDFLSADFTTEETAPLEDFLKDKDEPEEISSLDDFLTSDIDLEETVVLDDSLKDELISEETAPLDDFLPPESKPEEILPQDDASKPEDRLVQPPPSEDLEKPQALEDVPTPPIGDFDVKETPIESVPSPEPSTPDDSLEEDIPQQTESPDDFEPEIMSPGFGEDSDWLEMLHDPGAEEKEQEVVEPPPPSSPGKRETDWLERIKRLNRSAEEVDDDSSFPDWLSVSEKKEEKPVEEPEEPETPTEDVPDWLQLDENDTALGEFLRRKDLSDEEVVEEIPKEQIPETETTKESETPAEDKPGPKKFPAWASKEDSEALDPQKIPDDLKFLAGISPGAISGKSVDPFQIEGEESLDTLFDEELPSWLSTASEEDLPITVGDEITVGELPGWVEAMRPVVESIDTTGLADDEDYIENYGPLAGIPSVLPAEAETPLDPERIAKKPLDLTASKSHQEYVKLLKKIIGEESKTREIKKIAPLGTQRILRWFIAIILLVTITGTIIFGGQIQIQTTPQGLIETSSYSALFDQIEELRRNQSVLIAFDYQPASMGEMHAAAAGVVDHLMEREVYLSFVSTHPTGPALAEHFLISTQEENNYKHSQQYVNLGYLPGESAGLLSFVIAPKKIIPLAFDGSNAWESPPLKNVNNIEDFRMVIIITDDPNTAKIWIEQVGTILNDTPLNMIVSAQVEPLIQPYFRTSPQLLSGYVAGVVDSMKYEHLQRQANFAHKIWLPFNVGIIITVSTVFIGGLANGVLSLFSRHRAKRTGESS